MLEFLEKREIIKVTPNKLLTMNYKNADSLPFKYHIYENSGYVLKKFFIVISARCVALFLFFIVSSKPSN